MQKVAALCDSWDSNWMDGSPTGFDENIDNQHDADAFEAGLEPLPTWDGAAYSPNGAGKEVGGSARSHAASERHWRQQKRTNNDSHTHPERQEAVLNSLDLGTRNPDHDGDGGYTNSDSSVLRTSKLVVNPNVVVERPMQHAAQWSSTLSGSEAKKHDYSSEEGGTLTHVIKVHRTGSVVVECKKGLHPPLHTTMTGDQAVEVGTKQEEERHGYYSEEERFWQERCPAVSKAGDICTGARGGKGAESRDVVHGKTPTAKSPTGTPVLSVGNAKLDYCHAEAACTSSSPQQRKPTECPGHSSSCSDDDDQMGVGKGGKRGQHRRKRVTHFEDDNDNHRVSDDHEQVYLCKRLPRPSARGVAGGTGARRKGNAAGGEQFRSLRNAETVLAGVLESVDSGLSSEEDSSWLRNTSQQKRVSTLRQKVSQLFRRETLLQPGRPENVSDHRCDGSVRTSLNGMNKVDNHRDRHGRNTGGSCEYDGDVRDHLPSPRSVSSSERTEQKSSPLVVREKKSVRLAGERAATGVNPQQQQQKRHQQCTYRQEGEGDEEESAGRVAELSRKIALRCLDMEQECLRRERSQTRLFQEQLRGVRRAAQDLTVRTIRDERARASRLLKDMRKTLQDKEKEFAVKIEQAEEAWKAERGALVASIADSKGELEKTRRHAREAAESAKREAQDALEKQRQELQRGWAEQKGLLRRSAEETLRRAMEGKAREEEKAALQAQAAKDSLSAQVRSWKTKAEAADRRAAEERDKRRAMEDGAKGFLAEEVDKARQAQETILRDLRTKSESDRVAHAEEVERLKEEHRANLLRVHQDKKKSSEAVRQQHMREIQELRSEAAAKAEEAATRATAERAEALRRLRLAHDVEMRRAGRDILRLERQARRCHHQQCETDPKGLSGVDERSKLDSSPLSPLPIGAFKPKPFPEAATESSCLEGVEGDIGSRAPPSANRRTSSPAMSAVKGFAETVDTNARDVRETK